ncbi:cytochrome b/b6 domain-containing protein [Saccharospirillum salsuginis]|uniref:Cytochrome b561 n=1 Tax=Saccharospirillum salsuginis TaxID=418750 RepID=A0A918K2H4_9GAMM|nr:cytochrome b/b6 domain-containing protein [Saccharospirillum salsuginis]GGX39816.1 cytochrome b561 [Saccharospirillum salsuginis]
MNTTPMAEHVSSAQESVRVWDPLVRIFHWSLVAFFGLAWLASEEWQSLHEWSGYTVAGLVGFRWVWGLIGTRHARFSDFVRRPSVVVDYLKGLVSGRARHYKGHNPAGGWMVVLLLVSLTVLTLTGMTLAGLEGRGLLAGTAWAALPEDLVEEVHEVFANMLLALVFVHVAGVVVSSWLHRENLVRAMITGRKPSVDSREDD